MSSLNVNELTSLLMHLSRDLARDTSGAAVSMDPKLAPTFAEIGSGHAVFCGDGSPLTQVCWLGFEQPLTTDQLDEVERFFSGRATNWEYVIHPMCDPSVLSVVVSRGHGHAQYENVMAIELANWSLGSTSHDPIGISVVEVAGSARIDWASLSMRAFFGGDIPENCTNLANIIAASSATRAYLATIDGQPAGCASMSVGDRAVYLGGAATLPEYRGKGVQSALLRKRIADAQANGASVAFCECLVGSQSQRNQERAGFRVLHTKIVLTRDDG